MRKVKIDMGELIDAFENCSIEQNYFLDLESGEITFVSEYSLTEEEKEEIYEDIDSNRERYLAVPERDSHREYNDMVDFALTVQDKNLQEKLEIALDGKGAFRRFRDVLSAYPQEKERWFEFKNTRTTEHVREWLKENELEVE